MLVRQGTDYARPASEFAEMVRRRYPDRKVTEVDLDTREGAATASLYDIMQYPAVVVTADDGRPLDTWQGMPMPLIDEVMGAAMA